MEINGMFLPSKCFSAKGKELFWHLITPLSNSFAIAVILITLVEIPRACSKYGEKHTGC